MGKLTLTPEVLVLVAEHFKALASRRGCRF